ncbi:MAG: RDD family protein [Dehalococcoidia bacterium]|nr:RDD family protein [Dehalococcoidia bacterium]
MPYRQRAPTSAYCYRCGLQLSGDLYTQAEGIGNPAGFWIRLGAYIIDEVLLILAGILLTVTFTEMDAEQAFNELAGESAGWATTLITIVIGVAYYTFTVGQWGQTVGKAILGLKVTRKDGSHLTYWRSFTRYWAYFASFVPLGLGFISIGLSSQKRGWHDLICDTRVVNLRT